MGGSALFRRFIAIGIDAITILILCFGFLFLFGLMDKFLMKLEAFEVTIFFYFLLFMKDAIGGRSFGKRIMGIKVMTEPKVKNLFGWRFILRNIGFIIGPIDVIIFLSNKKNNRIGDILFKTKVI